MEVKCATSFDERFDPNNVLNRYIKYNIFFIYFNRDPKKFWITTGLYPQELLIDLGGTKPINEIRFVTTGGKSFKNKIFIENLHLKTSFIFLLSQRFL